MNSDETSQVSKCAYCTINDANNSEHVFPHSLGGANEYIDCVCNECNNKFSTLERELLQKSLIGLMRSHAGIEGYKKDKVRPAPLKYPEIFFHDKVDHIVYEIGLYQGFSPFMRPQIIEVNDKFYFEGPSKDDIITYVDLYNKWRHENLVLVTQFPKKKGDDYEAVRFKEEEDGVSYQPESLKRVKKEIILYTLMKDNDEMKDDFEPRLFLDDRKKLVLRCREIEEGIDFLKRLLEYTKNPAPFGSYNQDKPEKPQIRVSMKFDMVKMQRALVKIGLNCLMHYHPETKNDSLLDEAKAFVLNETPIKSAIQPKVQFLDAGNEMHYVLFYQLNEGLMVRTSLFEGQFIYTFLIEGLQLYRPGQFSGVEVYYKTREQNYLNMDEFLLNRLDDLGWLSSIQN